jgi:hypothetical protein
MACEKALRHARVIYQVSVSHHRALYGALLACMGLFWGAYLSRSASRCCARTSCSSALEEALGCACVSGSLMNIIRDLF